MVFRGNRGRISCRLKSIKGGLASKPSLLALRHSLAVKYEVLINTSLREVCKGSGTDN